jgi:15-cis-phytoene synthase
MASSLSPLGALVRRHDPDRFLTALFAPPAKRETLFVLFAVNNELARAREVTREPMLARIRLQWWREVALGERRRHEVAGPLGEALDAGAVARQDVLDMIDGREAEAEEAIADLAAWRAYLLGTAGALATAAGRVLGGDGAALERLRLLGAGYGAAGLLRSVPVLARQGRCLLPEDLLGAHGLTFHAAVAAPGDARLRPVLAALAGEGLALLAEGRGAIPAPVRAAALPAVLARRDLRRVGRPAAPRGLGDRLAVLAAGAGVLPV